MTIKEEFENDIQSYTICEICLCLDWCIIAHNKEVCENCYGELEK